MSAARIVLTGASMGIGRCLALRWARDGAHLALAARNAAELETLAGEVRAAGGRAVAVPCDVTLEEDRLRLVEVARAELGGIDRLVNNAGRGYYGALADAELAEVEALFALNFFAPLRLTQLALPDLMRARGSVIMVSSIAGVAAAPRMGIYAASKFALEGLSVSLRAELARSGVQVLVVRPGPVDTPFRANAVTKNVEAGVRTRGVRAQQPEEVAEQIVKAVRAGTPVLETSLYVHAASFAARSLPPLFRRIARRMARSPAT